MVLGTAYSVPCCLGTGMASPVISDSSVVDSPSSTIASTGIFSPGTTCQKQLHVHVVKKSYCNQENFCVKIIV